MDLSESSYYGQGYDYYSSELSLLLLIIPLSFPVMHYDSLAFSKNGFETMVAKRPEMTSVIGAAIDFSPVCFILERMNKTDSRWTCSK